MNARDDRRIRYLVADVGGTNARLATVGEDRRPRRARTYACRDFPDFAATAVAYLAEADEPRPMAAVLAVAAPITGGRVDMTNSPWVIDADAIRRSLGLDRVVMINDFAAQAAALPALGPHDVAAVGGGAAEDGAPRVVLGPGTGLGVAALVPAPSGPVVVAGEGGHAAFAPTDEGQARVVRRLARRFGRISAERLLSGPGLVNLYEALATEAGREPAPLEPSAVVAGAAARNDPDCRAAVAMFCTALGAVAGDLALLFGARGGVYVGGGVVPRLGSLFDEAAVRRAFEDKGRFRGYVSTIPLFRITMADPALLGAARAVLDPGAGAFVAE